MDNAGMNAQSSTSEKHRKASESREWNSQPVNRPELTKSLKNENKSRFCSPLSLIPIILSRCTVWWTLPTSSSPWMLITVSINYCQLKDSSSLKVVKWSVTRCVQQHFLCTMKARGNNYCYSSGLCTQSQRDFEGIPRQRQESKEIL